MPLRVAWPPEQGVCAALAAPAETGVGREPLPSSLLPRRAGCGKVERATGACGFQGDRFVILAPPSVGKQVASRSARPPNREWGKIRRKPHNPKEMNGSGAEKSVRLNLTLWSSGGPKGGDVAQPHGFQVDGFGISAPPSVGEQIPSRSARPPNREEGEIRRKPAVLKEIDDSTDRQIVENNLDNFGSGMLSTGSEISSFTARPLPACRLLSLPASSFLRRFGRRAPGGCRVSVSIRGSSAACRTQRGTRRG